MLLRGESVKSPMSQMGHFQTSGRVRARSALPPTTDMRRLRRHVRLVPIAEMDLLTRSPRRRGQGKGSSIFRPTIPHNFPTRGWGMTLAEAAAYG
jgi:hypothetical protein